MGVEEHEPAYDELELGEYEADDGKLVIYDEKDPRTYLRSDVYIDVEE